MSSIFMVDSYLETAEETALILGVKKILNIVLKI